MLKYILLLPVLFILLAVAGLWLNWQVRSPSHDRPWKPLYATLPDVERQGETYRVSPVRNWSYGQDGTTEPDWMDVTLDPAELVDVYYVVKPFGPSPLVAHTMLAFEFSDGAGYVASVEARREEGEDYGGLRAGLLPMHEYMFVWATERDMYANATIYQKNDLYIYRLDIPDEAKRAVLVAMLEDTETIAGEPQFYNTFVTNCTNVLARAVNRVSPGAVPWNKAWYLPGISAKFLAEQGMIAAPEGFDALHDKSLATRAVADLYDVEDPIAFATALRDRLRAD